MSLSINKIIGSGLFSGYFPIAPGTIGSIIAFSIYFIPGMNEYYILIPLTVLSFIAGIKIGDYFESIYGKDPKQFTLDEFVGSWIVLLVKPDTILLVITSFIVWRFFDIYKPYPANIAENLPGGLGIMLDDVISGMYSLIIIYIFKVTIY